MSNNQQRLKLTAARGAARREGVQDAKDQYKQGMVHSGSKRGEKRRLKDDEGASNKRACNLTKKAADTRNLAKNRLIGIQQKLKKEVNEVKQRAEIIVKKENNNVTSIKSKNNSTSPKGIASRCISKTSVNERLKHIKQSNVAKGSKTTKQHDTRPVTPNFKIIRDHNTSYSISKEYIVVSEASDSDCTPRTVTSANDRLARIKYSQKGDKTLSPQCNNTKAPINRNLFTDAMQWNQESKPIKETLKTSKAPCPVQNTPLKQAAAQLMETEVQPLNPKPNLEIFSALSSTPGKCIKCSKEFLTENWILTHQCSGNTIDSSMSDSLVVNVDDTMLNKSELPDPQEDVSMDWDSLTPTMEMPPAPSHQSSVDPMAKKENTFCIVTDTNVFMHFLNKIQDITNYTLKGSKKKVIIYIPWMVLKELDHLKDFSGGFAKQTALEAQKFINSNLTKPNSRFIGQSIEDMSQQKDIGMCPDDKILACCMQAIERYEDVVLLTNDINLRNKALVNRVEVSAPHEILTKMNNKLLKNTKFRQISTKLGTLLSQILCECSKDAYGEPWKRMDLLQNPPWSLFECIKRFKRYWTGVFRHILLKQSIKTIDELHDFLSKNGQVVDDSEGFNEFMKQIIELLVFLRDIPSYKASVKASLSEIIKIANT